MVYKLSIGITIYIVSILIYLYLIYYILHAKISL